MSAFLLVFFSVYGAMHAYVLWTLYRGLGGGLARWVVPILFCVAMILAPLSLRYTERTWSLPAARVVHFIVWTWLALVFWGDFFALLIDVYNGIFWCALKVRAGFPDFRCPYKAFPYVLGVGWLLFVVWGFWEGDRVELRTVRLTTDKLPATATPLRLVQISDLHLGMTVRNGRSQRVVDLVREAKPDLVVATGDFVDGAGTHMEELMPPWHDLKPPLGKYAIIGNHEVYPGLDRSVDLLEAGGFTVLRGQTAPVGQHFLLVGVDDPAVRHHSGKPKATEQEALAGADPDRFVILLKHQPRVDPHSLDAVDLQLSGHTHGGQIFPFSIVVNLYYPFPYARLVHISDRMSLYVSRGAGLWGPPLRVLAPADVTLFIIGPAGTD